MEERGRGQGCTDSGAICQCHAAMARLGVSPPRLQTDADCRAGMQQLQRRPLTASLLMAGGMPPQAPVWMDRSVGISRRTWFQLRLSPTVVWPQTGLLTTWAIHANTTGRPQWASSVG